MSLALSMAGLEHLILAPMDQRDVRWIHAICTATRMVHISVWRFCPNRDYVQHEVLKLLERSQNELRSMANCGDFNENEVARIDQYLQNIDLRISNIRDNFLAGKSSGFLPDDSLTEPPAKAL
jgi:hypothetical protein